MLTHARKYLQETIRRRGVLLDVTDMVVPSTASTTVRKSVFGQVVVGCIRDRASLAPEGTDGGGDGDDDDDDDKLQDEHGTCYKFTFQVPKQTDGDDSGSNSDDVTNTDVDTYLNPIFVAVKTFKADTSLNGYVLTDGVLKHSYTNYNADNRYIGNTNAVREALMGRMLNMLVKKDVTPHFPCIYEYFTLQARQQRGTVTELADIDVYKFARNLQHVDDADVRLSLIRTILLQVLQALIAAETHFNFKHMDLHAGNVMMSYVDDANYCYAVDEEVYVVPNHGMCWKIIDFGMSTSTVLFGEADALEMLHNVAAVQHIFKDLGKAKTAPVVAAAGAAGTGRKPRTVPDARVGQLSNHGTPRPSRTTHILDGEQDMAKYAYETVDFIRFLSTLWLAIPETLVAERAYCYHTMQKLEAASMLDRFRTTRGTAQAVHTLAAQWPVVSADKMGLTTQTNGLLRYVFAEIGKDVRVKPSEVTHLHRVCHVVFDVDTALYDDEEALESLESDFYTINKGALVRKNVPRAVRISRTAANAAHAARTRAAEESAERAKDAERARVAKEWLQAQKEEMKKEEIAERARVAEESAVRGLQRPSPALGGFPVLSFDSQLLKGAVSYPYSFPLFSDDTLYGEHKPEVKRTPRFTGNGTSYAGTDVIPTALDPYGFFAPSRVVGYGTPRPGAHGGLHMLSRPPLIPRTRANKQAAFQDMPHATAVKRVRVKETSPTSGSDTMSGGKRQRVRRK